LGRCSDVRRRPMGLRSHHLYLKLWKNLKMGQTRSARRILLGILLECSSPVCELFPFIAPHAYAGGKGARIRLFLLFILSSLRCCHSPMFKRRRKRNSILLLAINVYLNIPMKLTCHTYLLLSRKSCGTFYFNPILSLRLIASFTDGSLLRHSVS
jgi:hypothetical protein